jgi:hypothetical protein
VKAAEIVIGQDYACGTKGSWGSYRRARVLEVGKHRVLPGSDKEVPAARIMLPDGAQEWVVLRSVVVPWAEHEVDLAGKSQAQKALVTQGPQNAERARNVVKELAGIGLDTGTPSFELAGENAVDNGYVRVKLEFLEDVLDALT